MATNGQSRSPSETLRSQCVTATTTNAVGVVHECRVFVFVTTGSALCTHTHLQDLRPALEVRGARGGRHQVGARDGEKGAELARPRPRHRLQ
eukprot:510263-Pyramimonas_sp.AAC.1